MKRAILLATAGVAVGLFSLAGCSDKSCSTCGVAVQEPCCQGDGGTVTQGGAPVERRTEVPRESAAQPAR